MIFFYIMKCTGKHNLTNVYNPTNKSNMYDIKAMYHFLFESIFFIRHKMSRDFSWSFVDFDYYIYLIDKDG